MNSANHRVARPSPESLSALFESQTGHPLQPPASAIYCNTTPTPLLPIPEYADSGGVLIAYPGSIPRPAAHIQLAPATPRDFGIPDELIIRMQQADTDHPVRIFILCDAPDVLPGLLTRFARVAAELDLTFDPDLVHVVPWDTDTYWTRDYGPWWVKNQHTGHFGIAKHIYTSLGGGSVGLVGGAEHVTPREGLGIFRPNDDAAAVKFSDFLNAPIRAWNAARWHRNKLPQIPPHTWYCTGLLEVGGNFMATSDGIIASSYLVALQNELPVGSRDESTNPSADVIAERMTYVLEQLNRFMGANTYHVLSDPTGTYIGHVDCWGKFLGDRKVLIADSQDPAISKAFAAISDTFTAEGFAVTRVMCPDVYLPQASPPAATTAAYTNSLILNDHVYVPVAGGIHEAADQAALEAYRSALPGYTVVGIPPKPDTPWLGTDALHCRTHEVPRQVVDDWLRSQQMA
ncbi:MAG: agmatine deiminase family protein [Micropruina sp.]|nr:agmatine deiminase family protein [Micropruina sp.]